MGLEILTKIFAGFLLGQIADQAKAKDYAKKTAQKFDQAYYQAGQDLEALCLHREVNNLLSRMGRGELIHARELFDACLSCRPELGRNRIADILYKLADESLKACQNLPKTGDLPWVPKLFYDEMKEVVQQTSIEEKEEESTPKPIFIVPFMENTSLRHYKTWVKQISDQLEAKGQAAVVGAGAEENEAAGGRGAAVVGLGGLGKTAMAARYARQFRGRYLGVFWLDMENGLAAACRKLCETAGRVPELPDPAGLDDRLIITDQVLRVIGSRTPRLVVLDNVASTTAWDDCSKLPTLCDSHLLVTSRNRDLPLPKVKMDLPEPGPALDIFLAYARGSGEKPLSDGEKAAAESLVKTAGRLPLALEILGSLAGAGYGNNWTAIGGKGRKGAPQAGSKPGGP